MKVLVTGANGFIGKNLCVTLRRLADVEVLAYDLDQTRETFDTFLREADVVIHLAGVNRPKEISEFQTGNTVFTEDLLEQLKALGRATPIFLASSTQAALDNPYGASKRAAEDAVLAYHRATGAPVFIYRLANVFGKWCRPNYNSAVATWCHNIARGLPIQVRDREATVTLVYIDDVVQTILAVLRGEVQPSEAPLSVTPAYTRTLGEITELLYAFHDEPQTLNVPNQQDDFTKKLYATYLSALPEDQFSYPLTMHCDARGSFTEVLHSDERGQVSINISKPGITKGQHWHHTKHEKFLVVSGEGVIRFRKMVDDGTVLTYPVSGAKLEVVRIPPGYTHNIENTGTEAMVTLMWANEVFNPDSPDTFAEPVE